MSGDGDEPGRSRAVRTRRYVALAIGVLAAFAMIPACVVAMLSVMMFDAPGSEDVPYTRALFLASAAAPFVLGATSALGLTAFRSFTPMRFRLALLLPAAWLAFAVAALVLLGAQCGGSFACRP